MKIELMAPAELVPYAKNPRKNQPAVDYVANSIKEFGFRNPILIDKDRVIIAGHTRLLAAEKLGIKQVPVIRIEDLTPDQVKALRLADNKTAEFAEWDRGLLDEELADLRGRLDMETFGFRFRLEQELPDFFNRETLDGAARQEGNEEYNEFLEKFEPKKTTDDCYTPEPVYEVIADWVAKEYNLSRSDFVRPFYPGGDYERYNYPPGSVVVDNPPFSIMAQILRFYQAQGQPFFLFAPGLTCIGSTRTAPGVSVVCAHCSIVYENGATVVTSFLTNLEPGIVARSVPDLHDAVEAVQKEDKRMPSYKYPDAILTSSMLGYMAQHGVAFTVRVGDAEFIRKLDSQGDQAAIYGGGYLLSEKAAAEKAAAEKAAAEKAAAEQRERHVWKLSPREIQIQKMLGEM